MVSNVENPFSARVYLNLLISELSRDLETKTLPLKRSLISKHCKGGSGVPRVILGGAAHSIFELF